MALLMWRLPRGGGRQTFLPIDPGGQPRPRTSFPVDGPGLARDGPSAAAGGGAYSVTRATIETDALIVCQENRAPVNHIESAKGIRSHESHSKSAGISREQ